MALEHVVANFPTVARVLGAIWLGQQADWIVPFIEDRSAWYAQLEADLAALLGADIPIERLIDAYRDSLRVRKEIQKTIYEINGAALLAACARRIDIHVPRGDASNRNYDVFADIEGTPVAAESKTRKDEFPFNMPVADEEAEIPIYGGSRATLDPHDADVLGFPSNNMGRGPNHKITPESTVIRQILQDALSQLPDNGCNVILFGQIDGDVRNLEDALFGTEYVEARRNLETGKITHHWLRAPNGAFNSPGKEFELVSGVIWSRLWNGECDLSKTYRGYLNSQARFPLPAGVVSRLRTIASERSTPEEEGD